MPIIREGYKAFITPALTQLDSSYRTESAHTPYRDRPLPQPNFCSASPLPSTILGRPLYRARFIHLPITPSLITAPHLLTTPHLLTRPHLLNGLTKAAMTKQDKSNVIAKVNAQGFSVDDVLVTRRPGDIMFSQAAYTQSGFCQGFVLAVFKHHDAFKPTLNMQTLIQQAQTAQQGYESAFYQRVLTPKASLYRQNGFSLRPSKNMSSPQALIQHLKSKSASLNMGYPSIPRTLLFDIQLSGGQRQDHTVGIALQKQTDGTISGAVIDADRGIRRTMNKNDLNEFFQDLEKQCSGEKTKNGHNRKFHSWCNRHISVREVVVN